MVVQSRDDDGWERDSSWGWDTYKSRNLPQRPLEVKINGNPIWEVEY